MLPGDLLRHLLEKDLKGLPFASHLQRALVSYRNYRRNMLCLPNRKDSKEDAKASMPFLVSSVSDLARAMSDTPRP